MTLSRSDSGPDTPAPTRSAIRLRVNGDALERPSPTSVASLLESLDISGRVAVAVNRRVIVRSAHAETTLSDGDRVEILEAVGGG
jgi:sulfur carrier protein